MNKYQEAYQNNQRKFLKEYEQYIINGGIGSFKSFCKLKRQLKPNKRITPKANGRKERWKASEEGQYMKKHCSRQYYETLREM